MVPAETDDHFLDLFVGLASSDWCLTRQGYRLLRPGGVSRQLRSKFRIMYHPPRTCRVAQWAAYRSPGPGSV